MTPLLLTTTLSPAAGGLAASVPPIAHGLAARGWRVPVVGVSDPADPGAAKAWGPEVHAHAPQPPRALGRGRRMAVTLARIAPDLVDVQGIWTWTSCVNLRHHRATGTPYVVTPRGMLDPWARANAAWKKQLVRLLYEDAHLRAAACLRATAEMEADHFRSFGLNNPVAVIPNGVSVPPLVPRRPRGAPRRILFLSRVHPKKGLPFLLQAWTRLAPLYPDWELVIAGPDERGHTCEMQALAARIGAPRTLWPGPVQGAAKDALYRSADLFVLPTHAENFGLVVAEALSYGLPVITTRNAPWQGLEDYRCGWWIPLDQAALDDALAQALALPDAARQEMGVRGHAYVDAAFGWDGILTRMAALYEWVAKGGSPPDFVER